MPLLSDNPKERHWENIALPVITTLTPGVYTNPQITIDEFGRVTNALSGTGTGGVIGFSAQVSGAPVVGGPFNVLNFTGANTDAVLGAPGTLDITVTSAGSITAFDEGAAVTGGPFTSINLIGDAAIASDGGGGQLDITVSTGGGARHQFIKGVIGTASLQPIGGPINALSVVREVTVAILVPYSTGTDIQVQDGLGNILLDVDQINPQLIGSYSIVMAGNITAIANPQISAIVNGTPTTGSAVVEVIYQTA